MVRSRSAGRPVRAGRFLAGVAPSRRESTKPSSALSASVRRSTEGFGLGIQSVIAPESPTTREHSAGPAPGGQHRLENMT